LTKSKQRNDNDDRYLILEITGNTGYPKLAPYLPAMGRVD